MIVRTFSQTKQDTWNQIHQREDTCTEGKRWIGLRKVGSTGLNCRYYGNLSNIRLSFVSSPCVFFQNFQNFQHYLFYNILRFFVLQWSPLLQIHGGTLSETHSILFLVSSFSLQGPSPLLVSIFSLLKNIITKSRKTKGSKRRLVHYCVSYGS